jgi:hypothetical protein
MWSRSLSLHSRTGSSHSHARNAARKRHFRRLLLEDLECRNLMAFNVLGEYSTGAAPADVLLADVNGDARADMIVAGATLNVRLGNGDGTFGAASSHPIASNSVASGDLDGDGSVDLVATVSSETESHLSVLKGNGDGTFQPAVSLPIPPQTFEVFYYDPDIGGINSYSINVPQTLSSVVAGDLNDDGRMDLVATGSAQAEYSGDNYVNVLLGNGNGGFAEPAVHPLGVPGDLVADGPPGAVAIADLNQDGHHDVVTSRAYSGMNVLLGNGSGVLGNPIYSGRFGDESVLPLGDVDGDGILDTLSTMGLAVQRGDGAGGFVPQPSINVGYQHHAAEMGDVDGDGDLDLVVVGVDWLSSRKATVLAGNGLGQFSALLTTSLGGASNSSLVDVALADLTGDGLPELVTIDRSHLKAVVAINDGNHDVPAAIAISDAVAVNENSPNAAAVFTVTITGEHSGVSIGYSTSDFGSTSMATAGSDYVATSGTLTFAPGESSKTITVPVMNDTIYEGPAEHFTLHLSQTGGLIVTDSQGLATIMEDDPAPLLSIGDVARNEGNNGITVFSFPLSLSAPSAAPVQLDFRTFDGTATSYFGDYDYNPRDEVGFVIAPGQTSAVITVEVMDDLRNEPNETFLVDLYNVYGATVTDSQAVGTILNDDGGSPVTPPTIKVGDAQIAEGNSGTRSMTFTITLSKASNKEVSVNYATANGTAKTSDSDYTGLSGTLKFAPGQTTKTITVKVKGDTKKESNETFSLKLSGAKNATINDGTGVGTILNDDGASASRSLAAYAAAVDAILSGSPAGRSKLRRR